MECDFGSREVEFADFADAFARYTDAALRLNKQRYEYQGIDFSYSFHSEINRVDDLREEAERTFNALVQQKINAAFRAKAERVLNDL